MYYVIEETVVLNATADATTYFITTEPGTTNMSHEVRTEGWLGTTNDISRHARGEFETLEEARAKVFELCDDKYREREISNYEECEGVVESYYPGKYEPMDSESTGNWAYEGLRREVRADMTDAEIEALVEQTEQEANEQGYTLCTTTVEEIARELRDDLKAELED